MSNTPLVDSSTPRSITFSSDAEFATRAHLNIIENLPVYGAIVLVITHLGLHSSLLDGLSIAVLVARMGQTLVHVCFVQSERAVSVRFSLFTVQLVAMLWMVALSVG